MIYYIQNENDGAYIYPNKKRANFTALSVIKNICIKHLTSLESYLKAVKNILDSRYRIPIVLSSKYAFFSTKAMRNIDSIWINYFAVKEIIYLEKTIVFIFDVHHRLEIEISSKNYQRLVSLIFKVLKYKSSLEWMHF